MSRASHFLQSDAGLLTINGSASCVCEPEFIDGNRFIQFIGTYFGDCVYSNQDLASWCFGMLSLLTFIVVFLPQVWLNFTRKAVTGLSFGLLGLWVSLGRLSLFIRPHFLTLLCLFWLRRRCSFAVTLPY